MTLIEEVYNRYRAYSSYAESPWYSKSNDFMLL